MAPKKKTPPVAATTDTLELAPMKLERMRLTLIGDAPLVCHAWSQKAKQQMLDKQRMKARTAKVAKDPQQDFVDSLYPLPGGGYGFPSVAFKAAAVSAVAQVPGMTKVLARSVFHLQGEMVRIQGTPTPREDMVKIAMGTADIRFRGEFREWWCAIDVQYNAAAVSAEQIAQLFDIAGFGVGVGEWRPERNGSFGRFHVAGPDEMPNLKEV